MRTSLAFKAAHAGKLRLIRRTRKVLPGKRRNRRLGRSLIARAMGTVICLAPILCVQRYLARALNDEWLSLIVTLSAVTTLMGLISPLIHSDQRRRL